MQPAKPYIMENEHESVRLEQKTDKNAVKRQASWAGIKPGMKVLDVACGSGAASAALAELVGPHGTVTGIDFSQDRLEHAKKNYPRDNLYFEWHDIRQPYCETEAYDAIWSRFLLEYFKAEQHQIVKNMMESLKPGGIACLADLDYNGQGHYGLSERLERTLQQVTKTLEDDQNFDPYAGRKLFNHLYMLGFQNIDCKMEAHHLVFGNGTPVEISNWMSKIDVMVRNSGYTFPEYGGNFEQFREEVETFLESRTRFTYTPILLVRGIKP